jgi:hypothetical protein
MGRQTDEWKDRNTIRWTNRQTVSWKKIQTYRDGWRRKSNRQSERYRNRAIKDLLMGKQTNIQIDGQMDKQADR